MARAQPVFIAGLARSGTYALRAALLRHPAFHARESRMQETRIFVHPDWIADCLERRRARRFYHYMLGDDARVRAMLETDAAIRPRFAGARRRLAARVPGRARAWRLRGWHHHVRCYFHFATEARGARRILEKTPDHVHHLPELFATFPRARVILSIRHPVDAYASLRRRLERARAQGLPERRLRWMQVPPERFVLRFGRVVRHARRGLERWPGQALLVRYEDTTSDPEATLRRVCAFIDEPYDPALVGQREALRDAHGAPTKESRITANRSVWRDWLSASEARRLEGDLAPVLDVLGYRAIAGEGHDASRVTPGPPPLSATLD